MEDIRLKLLEENLNEKFKEGYTENVYEEVDGSEEYLVLTEEEAYDAAYDYIVEIIDELGLDAFTQSYQRWIIDNALNMDMFLDEEMDEEDLLDIYSLEDISRVVMRNPQAALDLDLVVNECIKIDGIAHFIASYDGNELDLGEGYYAYRTN